MSRDARSTRLMLVAVLAVCCGMSVTASGAALFREDFDGPLDPDKWVINHPDQWWWIMGRTHFPEPSTSGLPSPKVDNGACVIEHYQYNPYENINAGHPDKITFLGGELHTVMSFDPGQAYRFEARVKWETSPRGLVTSFFTYGYDDINHDSDEIDFEFLSNEVFPNNEVHTNTWDDSNMDEEPVVIPELDMTQWNTFRIYWYPDPNPRVVWTWIEPGGDERVLREEPTGPTYLPDEPMNLYFNSWAPNDWWPKAYDAGLQPDQEDNETVYRYWIDYVEVVPEPMTGSLLAFAAIGLLRRRRRSVGS